MSHGIKATFEVVGEKQVIQGIEQNVLPAGFRFGRMFPQLPAYRPTDASLAALGARMTFAPASPSEPPLPADDSELPAGYTYFGQFIDHDITRDGTQGSLETVPQLEADQVLQIRSPRLDLDSLYGDFGGRAEDFFEVTDPVIFRIGQTEPPSVDDPQNDSLAVSDKARTSHPNDLPRVLFGKDAGKPLIGDDRNDENLIVAQLHLAFLKFHNKVAAELGTKQPTSPTRLFARTRELVTKHYQWLVLDDFVRRLVHPDIFKAVFGVETLTDLADPVTIRPLFFNVTGFETPPMPLEFSTAAFSSSPIRRAAWASPAMSRPALPMIMSRCPPI